MPYRSSTYIATRPNRPRYRRPSKSFLRKCINATKFPHTKVVDGTSFIQIPAGTSHITTYTFLDTVMEEAIYNTAYNYDEPVGGATTLPTFAKRPKVLLESATSSYRFVNQANVGCYVKCWELTPRIDHGKNSQSVTQMLSFGTQLDIQAESYFIAPTDVRFNPMSSTYLAANYKISKPKRTYIPPLGKWNYRMRTNNLMINGWLSNSTDASYGMRDRRGHTKYLLVQITGDQVWVGETGTARNTGSATTAHLGLHFYYKQVYKFRLVTQLETLYDYSTFRNNVELVGGTDALSASGYVAPKEVVYDIEATDSVRPVNNVLDGTF